MQSANFLPQRKVLHTSSQLPSNKYNVLRHVILGTTITKLKPIKVFKKECTQTV